MTEAATTSPRWRTNRVLDPDACATTKTSASSRRPNAPRRLSALRRPHHRTPHVHRSAKQLGCTLEEITDLADAWDSNECAPIKHRLPAPSSQPAGRHRSRIAELTTFASELRATAKTLESHRSTVPVTHLRLRARPKGAVPVPLTTKKSAR